MFDSLYVLNFFFLIMKYRKSSISLKGIHPKDNTGKRGHGKVSLVRDEAYFFMETNKNLHTIDESKKNVFRRKPLMV